MTNPQRNRLRAVALKLSAAALCLPAEDERRIELGRIIRQIRQLID